MGAQPMRLHRVPNPAAAHGRRALDDFEGDRLNIRSPIALFLFLSIALAAFASEAGAQTAASREKGSVAHIRAATQRVDGKFMRHNAKATNDWPSYGLDYAETRYSRLKQINAGNVKDLGLVWSYNLESK